MSAAASSPTTKDDTRTRILDAAGAIFAQRGFAGATVRQICRAAGVNLASVNYHFGDKERLYIQTVKHAHQLRAEQVPLPDWPQGTPPEQRLRDFLRSMIHRMIAVEDLPWQAELMMREILSPTSACRELVEDYFRPHLRLLLEILGEMVPEAMPEHRRKKLAFSIVGQCLFYRFNQRIMHLLLLPSELAEHFEPDALADHIADFSLAALGRNESFVAEHADATENCPSNLHGE